MKLRRPRTTSLSVGHVPAWVRVFTDFGRPLVAVVVLVLCAPGEQHLAELAGWNGRMVWLSWGWAGLLAMYAGIAAVVATVRPPGAPGRRSAVSGAIVALLMAMAAQPVSHLFVTGWLSAEPRVPWILVVSVSCVPPLIFGHLLHLAASPSRDKLPDMAPVPAVVPAPVPDTAPVPAVVPAAVPAPVPDTAPVPAVVPAPVPDTAPVPVSLTRAVSRDSGTQSLSDYVRCLLIENPDMSRDEVETDVLSRDTFGPGTKINSIRKAYVRAVPRGVTS